MKKDLALVVHAAMRYCHRKDAYSLLTLFAKENSFNPSFYYSQALVSATQCNDNSTSSLVDRALQYLALHKHFSTTSNRIINLEFTLIIANHSHYDHS